MDTRGEAEEGLEGCHRGPAAVEAQGELVEVGLEVVVPDAVVGPGAAHGLSRGHDAGGQRGPALWRGGGARKPIAAQLGLNVKTVRWYIAAGPSMPPGSIRSEIVFSERQRKALTPNDFDSTAHLRQHIRAFFAERNRRARPIQWTHTAHKFLAKTRASRRLAAAG